MQDNYSKKPEPTGNNPPTCLCSQVIGRIPFPPKLVYSETRNQYLMYCPSCNIKTHPDINRQAVISEWYGMNATGSQHIIDLWLERYEKQSQETVYEKLKMGPRSQQEVHQ